MEFRADGGAITITVKPPTAADEYTPEQRRIIDAQLDEAEKGPFHGPFDSADEMITHINDDPLEQMAIDAGMPFVGADKNASPACFASCHFRQDRPPNQYGFLRRLRFSEPGLGPQGANGPQLARVKTCGSASRF